MEWDKFHAFESPILYLVMKMERIPIFIDAAFDVLIYNRKNVKVFICITSVP